MGLIMTDEDFEGGDEGENAASCLYGYGCAGNEVSLVHPSSRNVKPRAWTAIAASSSIGGRHPLEICWLVFPLL
jgi:hypothetical protein